MSYIRVQVPDDDWFAAPPPAKTTGDLLDELDANYDVSLPEWFQATGSVLAGVCVSVAIVFAVYVAVLAAIAVTAAVL